MLVPLFVFAVGAALSAATDPADFEYNEVVNKFYNVHREPREWRAASDVCRQEGASLPPFPSITDRILLNHIQYVNFNISQPFDFHLWLDVEVPTEGPRERGVYLATNGSVLSAANSLRLPFVCVRDGAECNTTPGFGFTPGPNGVSCYKFHEAPPKPISWLGASAVCQAEGAHLAIPNSSSELAFFNAFTKPKRGAYWLAIGVHDFMANGEFHTVDGQPLSSTMQAAIGKQSGGRCVYIDNLGNLRTHPCESGHASYLCEKDISPPVVVAPKECTCPGDKVPSIAAIELK